MDGGLGVTTMPHRPDAAISSILGFIVGMVLLTGSMAAVVYFMGTAPESGTTDEARQLESQTIRVVNTLATTPGQPANWTELRPVNGTELRAVGLLEKGSTIGSLEKFQYLQNGTINATRLAESYNLRNASYRVDADARVVPVPVMSPPDSRFHAVVHTDKVVDGVTRTYDIQMNEDSETGLALFEDATEHYEHKLQNWMPDDPSTGDEYDAEPSENVGNTFPDEPWFFESGLIPRMAGIRGTFTALDGGSTDSLEQRSVDAVQEYNSGNHEFTRFHVLTDGEPLCLPRTGPDQLDNVLLAGYHRSSGTSGCDEGVGKWRGTDGVETWALLESIDTTGTDNATLTFDHFLSTDHDEDSDQMIECTNATTEDECVRIRPSIAFWNTTSENWTRLAEDPHGPDTGCGDSGWNDTGHSEQTSHKWKTVSVDLCEALNNTDGKLWLAYWWSADCYNLNGTDPLDLGSEKDCGSAKNRKRLWMIDNIEVTTDGKVAYETDLDPEDEGRETLFISNGVDHSRYSRVTDTDVEDIVSVYPRRFVQAGGNAVAFTPGNNTVGSTGDWFGSIGLEVADNTDGSGDPHQHTKTNEPRDIVMRMPYELPTKDRAYAGTWNGFSLNQSPSVPGSGLPDNLTLTPLTDVQNTTRGHVGTLMSGTPYEDGGHVRAVAYDLPNFNKTELRDELLRNVYVSSVFSDPTFDIDGAEPPESGTVPVHALKRVILVHVTPDNEFQVPVEITLYMWPQGS